MMTGCIKGWTNALWSYFQLLQFVVKKLKKKGNALQLAHLHSNPGHELWIITERSQIEVAEMSFLHGYSGLSVTDSVKSGLIHLELSCCSSALMWFNHFISMPPGASIWRTTEPIPLEQDSGTEPRTCSWDYYVSSPTWENFSISQEVECCWRE